MEEIKAGKSLLGQGGLLTPLIKNALEAALEGELEAHLSQGVEESNRRNGKLKKTVKHSAGTFELESPRDRIGEFEPQLRAIAMHTSRFPAIVHLNNDRINTAHFTYCKTGQM